MITLIIAILLIELFGILNEFNPLLLVGILVSGLAVLAVMYLTANGMPTSSNFNFLMSFVCFLGAFLFLRIFV